MTVCLLVVIMGNTILNVGLPAIRAGTGAGAAEVQWVVNIYTLPLAALILVQVEEGRVDLDASVIELSSPATQRAMNADPRAAPSGTAATSTGTVTPRTVAIFSSMRDAMSMALVPRRFAMLTVTAGYARPSRPANVT